MRFLKEQFTVYSLLFIVLFGGFLRFYNLNWDQGHFFHPDERNIAMAVSRIHFFSQLNPKFFAYGSFPIYLYRVVGEILIFLTKNRAWVSGWPNINLVGRGVSALLSTLTIPLIFLLAKRVWNEKVGLLASFFMAFSPSLIQTAHYGVTESMLIFWLVLIAIFSLETTKKPTLKNYLKIGVVLGLAGATKISGISFLIIPLIVHLLHHFNYLKYHFRFLFSLASAFLTFAFFSPYTFLDKQKFLESMNYETGVALGRLKVVYVLQFEKTLPYLFQIKNFFWQIGLIVPIAILGGILLSIKAVKNKDKKLFTLLLFPIIYFAYAGSWHTKFIRYMVPALPFLALFAAWTLMEISKRWYKLGLIFISLAMVSTLFWGLAFFSIYTHESTRITASRWIYQNIPVGAKILGEHWDDGLPIDLPPNHPGQYKIEQLTIYEPDNQQKIQYLADKLSDADYVVINSRRLYGTLMYLPEKYPLTSRYYHLLFTGQLGYQKIAEFSSYPSLLVVTINDDKSEETFQVYDHPKVLIFKNQEYFHQLILQKILSYEKFQNL